MCPASASAADRDPDAAWTTWDLDRRSRERASRLPPFTHAASAAASGAPEHLLSGLFKSPLAAAAPSTRHPLMAAECAGANGLSRVVKGLLRSGGAWLGAGGHVW